MKKNIVFIASSLDGYIADKNGGLDWLEIVPNPENVDMGYNALIERVDAVVMGRKTFETVCNFDCEWPYEKPVFVLSNTLTEVPARYRVKAEVVSGELKNILDNLNARGFRQLYIDGGITIQSFLREDFIDELIITTMPVLLGGGSRLFDIMPQKLALQLVDSIVYLNEIVQSHYIRKERRNIT